MKIEELRNLQPNVFQRFVTILEQRRLAHAYLFSGDFVSFDMAIFLSQSLFCQEKEGVLPCQKCRSCRLIEANEFSDLTVIAPQGNVIKTDTIRELVKNFSQSGFESNKQVFIIRDAEKMHANAANSLLKVIEEPQSAIHIFLLTNQEEAVLPTIKSRTQIIGFPKNIPAMERMLEEEGLLKTQANLLAQLVSSQEEAKKLAENKNFLDLMGQAKKFTDLLLVEPTRAYLQVGILVSLAVEKAEQGRLFDLLSLILSEKMMESANVREKMDAVLKAKKMWQANVSLQNSLEYITL
ncbi:DNA polymerase III subunit delta' [Streptococcus suis]|uniref:DNA polymerase III subunit delta n=1 Tax=Streptococcus suis TaxID=1307 RepID=A0AAW9DE70_STRSU|nr:DNA polymerase III subunit delta' [Streptococcus suis]MBM0273202.1 DNA polymerase III subunit delta' [Streptococcus suis]MBO8083900.1 DNA polymerase III subunit delta' [Streptococcus suis]MCG9862264.1 DNA polymerase III subunit delta' [Streptococcus suis]MCK3877777.1 DNA polymerase III subunit delta' [Streptococcus suis]MCK3928868.1 DNA polymerase III subunit delta' [Streptococcus suis]